MFDTTTLAPLPDNGEAFIPSPQLPSYIGIATQTLARWRHEGKGPKFTKIGRKVAYRVADLKTWLAEQQRTSTAA